MTRAGQETGGGRCRTLRFIALLLCPALLLGATNCQSTGRSAEAPRSEPKHQGLPLSYWLDELDTPNSPNRTGAWNAIIAIGPEAVTATPRLKQWLQSDDPASAYNATLCLLAIDEDTNYPLVFDAMYAQWGALSSATEPYRGFAELQRKRILRSVLHSWSVCELAWPKVAEHLNDRDAAKRRQAVVWLGAMLERWELEYSCSCPSRCPPAPWGVMNIVEHLNMVIESRGEEFVVAHAALEALQRGCDILRCSRPDLAQRVLPTLLEWKRMYPRGQGSLPHLLEACVKDGAGGG